MKISKSKLKEVLRTEIAKAKKKRLREINATGGGASFSAGSGEQYATPKAFKKEAKSKKDSYNPDWSRGEVRRQIGSQQTQQTHKPKKGKGSYKRKPKNSNKDQY